MNHPKIFGYPTGVGCLLARKNALAKLRRPWFAGGTITVASVQGDTHYLAEGEMAFEDGTINYLSLPAVEIGLKHIATIGIDTIHERVRCLTGWLLVACFTQPQQRLTLDDFRLCIDGKSSGAVRVSVGLVSNFADAYHFVQFSQGFVDKSVK